jgi:hypothetical protein
LLAKKSPDIDTMKGGGLSSEFGRFKKAKNILKSKSYSVLRHKRCPLYIRDK